MRHRMVAHRAEPAVAALFELGFGRRPRVELLDMARYLEGSLDWFHGDGLHQTEWASQAFAQVLLNLLALLPEAGPAGMRAQMHQGRRRTVDYAVSSSDH